ncbi:hypothetical protein DL96DRAFT_1573279 [Flagelloscypha sp. PMI_526]|nr:hypothetical protein DL96DRAFT_1573279 [Flagelloscypha sp. PMI_526]
MSLRVSFLVVRTASIGRLYSSTANHTRVTRGSKQPKEPSVLEAAPDKTLRKYLPAANVDDTPPLSPDELTRQREESLAEFEKCIPTERPGPKKYTQAYREIMNTVLGKYSRRQLTNFAKKEYKLSSVDAKMRKEKIAEIIFREQWNWESPEDIEREHIRWNTITTIELPIAPRDFFFVLGQDGRRLRDICTDNSVTVTTTQSPDSNSIVLTFEGAQGHIDAALSTIRQVALDIQENVLEFKKAPSLPSHLTTKISRLSGVLVKELSPGKFRLDFIKSHPDSLNIAKRLLARAVCERASHLLSYSYIPPPRRFGEVIASRRYSQYPFLTSQALPWISPPNKLFRVRRVSEWLATRTMEDIRDTGGLPGGNGQILTPALEEIRLRLALLSSIPQTTDNRITVHATSGHLVHVAANASESILPPLPGRWPITQYFKWQEDSGGQRLFVPSISRQVLKTDFSTERKLYQLEYRPSRSAADTMLTKSWKNIRLEIKLEEKTPQPSLSRASPPPPSGDLASVLSNLLDHYQQDPDHPRPQSRQLASSDPQISDTIEPEPHSSPESDIPALSQAQCTVGDEFALTLMSGDRPMDAQFNVSSTRDLPEQDWPQPLSNFYETLKKSMTGEISSFPTVPLSFEFDNTVYYLHSNYNIRQYVETISHFLGTATTERILEEDTQQKFGQTRVFCSDINSESEWIKFLHRCDWLMTDSSDEVSVPFIDIHSLGREAGLEVIDGHGPEKKVI